MKLSNELKPFVRATRIPNVAVLALSSVPSGISYGFLYWTLPLIVEEIGQTMLVGLSYTLALLISVPILLLGGIVADAYGRKPVIIAGTGIHTFGVLLLAIFPYNRYSVVIAVILIQGIATITSPLESTLIADAAEEDLRGTAYSVVFVSWLLSAAFGSFALAYLNELLNIGFALTLCSFLGATALLLQLRLRETIMKKELSKSEIRKTVSGLRDLFTEKFVILLSVMTIIVSIETTVDDPYYSIFMESILGLKKSHIGLIFGLIPLAQATLQPIAGRLTDRFGPQVSLILGNLGGAIAIYFFACLLDPFYAMLFLLLASSFGAFHNIGFTTLTSLQTRKEHRATFFSAMDVLWLLTAIPAPTLGAFLWGISPRSPFYASVSLSLLFSLLTLTTWKIWRLMKTRQKS